MTITSPVNRTGLHRVQIIDAKTPPGSRPLQGLTRTDIASRFERALANADSVLKRGIEVLTGPTLHLQYIKRSEAARIEEELALALASAGLLVKGGH